MPANFSIMPMFTSVAEGETALVYVYRDETAGAASVDFQTSHGSANSTDYTPVTTTVNLPDGVAGANISITTLNDFMPESPEFFNVGISNPSSGFSIDPAGASTAINISDMDQAPVATDDSYSILHDQSTSGNVLTNDWDVNFDPLTASLVSGPSHATSFSLGANGAFSYMPELHWTGSTNIGDWTAQK